MIFLFKNFHILQILRILKNQGFQALLSYFWKERPVVLRLLTLLLFFCICILIFMNGSLLLNKKVYVSINEIQLLSRTINNFSRPEWGWQLASIKGKVNKQLTRQSWQMPWRATSITARLHPHLEIKQCFWIQKLKWLK